MTLIVVFSFVAVVADSRMQNDLQIHERRLDNRMSRMFTYLLQAVTHLQQFGVLS